MFTRLVVSLCAAILLTATSVAAQFVQQGSPLEPFSDVDDWNLGFHVAISADGNTVVATAFHLDGAGTSDAYVWSRQGAGWQAPTLLRTPSSNDNIEGAAISGDGNTILVANSLRNTSGSNPRPATHRPARAT